MDSRNSFIYTVLERIRALVDEPSVQAKYTNDYLVRHVIGPSQADVLSRLHLTAQAPVVLRYSITLDSTKTRYVLPPHVQEIRRFVVVSATDSSVVCDTWRRDLVHRRGWIWRVEGGPGAWELVLQSAPTDDVVVEIWYTPSGEFQPVFGTATFSSKPTNTFTLSTATLGSLDRRDNAYGGGIFRWLPNPTTQSSESILESIITSSDFTAGTHTVTLTRTLTPEAAADSTRDFEIVPPTMASMCELIALRSAMKLGLARRISQAQMKMLQTEYLMASKTVGDQMTFLMADAAYEKNTVHKPIPWEPLAAFPYSI